MANGRAPRGGLASRLPALLTGFVLVALAVAGTAQAQTLGSGAQAPGGLTGVLGQVPSPPSQVAQAAQAAAAQAAAIQVQPVNIAITIAINSPGSSPVIVQSNGNSGSAGAGNSNSSAQSSGTPPGNSGAGSAPTNPQGGNSSGGGGGPTHPAQQANQAAQAAGAQGAAVQVQPANIAVPIAINSPGSSPVIVQTNGNSAAAMAANLNSALQSFAPVPAAAAAPASQPPAPPTQNTPSSLTTIAGVDLGALSNLLGPVTGWNWNLAIDIPGLQLPVLSAWPFSTFGWPFPGGNDELVGNDEPAGRSGKSMDDAAPAARPPDRPGDAGGWGPSSGLSSGADGSGVSSSFVQSPANKAESSLFPEVPLPRPTLPAPPAGGGLFSPAGFILGAVATLALYLASLGLLLRRLGLASVPWRHQAYLTPLQRPG